MCPCATSAAGFQERQPNPSWVPLFEHLHTHERLNQADPRCVPRSFLGLGDGRCGVIEKCLSTPSRERCCQRGPVLSHAIRKSTILHCESSTSATTGASSRESDKFAGPSQAVQNIAPSMCQKIGAIRFLFQMHGRGATAAISQRPLVQPASTLCACLRTAGSQLTRSVVPATFPTQTAVGAPGAERVHPRSARVGFKDDLDQSRHSRHQHGALGGV
jgi:hypothetical protein